MVFLFPPPLGEGLRVGVFVCELVLGSISIQAQTLTRLRHPLPQKGEGYVSVPFTSGEVPYSWWEVCV